jgi:cytochrome b561
MPFWLNLLQLVLYVPLLALLGQGALYLLAAGRHQGNFFYEMLQLLSRPFTALARRATPRTVADRHVPWVTFFLLAIAYAVVTLEKIKVCVAVGVELCK